MKTPLAFAPILCLLAAFLTTPAMADSPAPARGTGPTGSPPIPVDQLGAAAQKQYSGDGIGIIPTANGARLKALFQRLEGEVTPEGFWGCCHIFGSSMPQLGSHLEQPCPLFSQNPRPPQNSPLFVA